MAKTWRIYNRNTGNIVRRCRSEEAAEAYISAETKKLKSNPCYQNAYLPWNVCPPDSELICSDDIPGHHVNDPRYQHTLDDDDF